MMTTPMHWARPPARLVACIDEERITIDAPHPAIRAGTGGVIGAAMHTAARVTFRPTSFTVGGYLVISSWAIFYEIGDFNALHTDRPDSDATALLALDDNAGPLIVCPSLAEASDDILLAKARRNGHPEGDAVQLQRDQFLVLPAHVPHHRPPAARPCRVLSLSLRATPAADTTQ